MSGHRFTAWLSDEERKDLRRLARREGCSENFVMRLAIRHLLYGAEIPAFLRREKVHSETR